MQEHRFDPCSGKIPHAVGAAKPVRHNYWAHTQELKSHKYWSLRALEPVLCNEKPLQWEACTPQLESN